MLPKCFKYLHGTNFTCNITDFISVIMYNFHSDFKFGNFIQYFFSN